MTNAAPVLRTCSPDDVEEILSLWARAGVAGSVPDTSEALLARLARDADLFVVAEAGGRVVGTLIGGWDGWRGNMYRLAVDPAWRRRGIARALVREVETRLRRVGATRITALVLLEEGEGGKFWPAVGYPADLTIRRHVRNV